MRAVSGKLVGAVVFLLIFGCAAATVFAFSTGMIDPASFVGPEGGLQLPDIQLPSPPDVPDVPDVPQVQPPTIAPGEVTTLADVVQPRPLLSEVPTPFEVSTEPRVVGANAFLAILMAILFGATMTVLGNTLRDEEDTIRGWLDKLGLLRLFTRGAKWGARRAVSRGCLTLPLILVIFALYGIIFAFLEQGTSIFSTSGALLAVTLAFSVGLVSLAGDVAQRIVARLWREDARFRIYPANLLLAAASVAASRFLVLTPGIVFGTPGGLDVDLDERKRARQVGLAFTTLATVAIVGGLGWAASGGVQIALNRPIDTRLADLSVAGLSAAQNVSLAIFLIAAETLFFEMLPLAYGLGQTFFRWSKLAWAALFVPIAFLFNHTLLNPESGFLDSFQASNVRLMWFTLFILVGFTAILWFYFNVLRHLGERPAAPPPPPTYPPNYGS